MIRMIRNQTLPQLVISTLAAALFPSANWAQQAASAQPANDKPQTTLKVGVKAKRMRAAWDRDYLLKVLAN